MKLSNYALKNNIKYRAAWNRFKAGKIDGAYKDEYGTIIVPDDIQIKPPVNAIYCRVSSSQNKDNLFSQKDRLVSYAIAKGYSVDKIVTEVGSGLNDKRSKLISLLNDDSVTRIIVEHSDRLTRFGFNYIQQWMEYKGVEIEVVNKAESDRDDLMQDFVSLVTSFTARLYGLRRSKRKTEKLIAELKN